MFCGTDENVLHWGVCERTKTFEECWTRLEEKGTCARTSASHLLQQEQTVACLILKACRTAVALLADRRKRGIHVRLLPCNCCFRGFQQSRCWTWCNCPSCTCLTRPRHAILTLQSSSSWPASSFSTLFQQMLRRLSSTRKLSQHFTCSRVKR